MARLQKESVESMSLRIQEITHLKERITRDESRLNEIINILMERDTSEKSKETDDLILELNSTGIRIERDKVSLAKLKAPSELTDEDRKYLPGPGSSEKFNIKY
ncbi:hypothetical protein [Bacteroides xylanisolvens]|uniref:hypothetical protein n=1 Tax=Bacteroides xylanisolvens TaxID=371601 RepID=UPI001F5AE9B0|nr:hypothetical protein [Bacteroides xylanisolvens]